MVDGLHSGVVAFVKAVATGSLAAASPGLLFTVPLGLLMVFDDGQLNGLSMMFAPLIRRPSSVLIASLYCPVNLSVPAP